MTPILQANAANAKRAFFTSRLASRSQTLTWRLLSGALFLALAGTGRAAILEASDGNGHEGFGVAASASGTSALVGSNYDENFGSAYLFRTLDTATGTVTQALKLTPSDPVFAAQFGWQARLSGAIGLIGRPGFSPGPQGTAYLFRDLDTATGAVTETAKLRASTGGGGGPGDFFGISVSLSGTSALVGGPGSGYLFRNLDTATGTITETARLTSANGLLGDGVALSGSIGLLGSEADNGGRGSVAVFRGLDTATGNVSQSAKLTASDGQPGDALGLAFSMSLAGTTALLGTFQADVGAKTDQGAAYVFRNLNTATGSTTQNAKLVASDGAADDNFGNSVSISGSRGLVGAFGVNGNRGAAYLFLNLDTATGTVMEPVKLTASISAPNGYFGEAVGLDGDRFVIGAEGAGTSGRAFSGAVSSVTTLDRVNATERISGLSFVSRIDWIIGETNDGNQVQLGVGDKADVRGTGKAVFIGKNAGSDDNLLRIDGTLTANEVYIGSIAGNEGNVLQLDITAAFQAIAFRLAPENLLKIEGDRTGISSLLGYLGNTRLDVWNGALWQQVTNTNYTDLIATSSNSGFTEVRPVPEPSVAILILASFGAFGLVRPHVRRFGP